MEFSWEVNDWGVLCCWRQLHISSNILKYQKQNAETHVFGKLNDLVLFPLPLLPVCFLAEKREQMLDIGFFMASRTVDRLQEKP